MADVFSKKKRSAVMSRIRGAGNKQTEIALMQMFRAWGVSGWRRSWPLFGKPDFVFPRARVVVFVDGCFWHSCPLPKHSPRPKTRRAWWAKKLKRNRERDMEVNSALRRLGWRVVRVWEHELKDERCVIVRVRRALAAGGARRKQHHMDR